MASRSSARLILLAVAFGALLVVALAVYLLSGLSTDETGSEDALKVLAYSSFVNTWGPGPEIAKRFEKKTGVKVELRDAEDAGLLLKKLELFPADVVIGFDQLLLPAARVARAWRKLNAAGVRFEDETFIPFDWGPLAFVYRKGEVTPPAKLDDLLDARFKSTLALQDPRTSSPGLQFLFWVLDEKGVDAGFEYLSKLKPSIHTLGASWSTAYGVFQDGQAKLALSYLTSPLYHLTQEKDDRYRAAVFAAGQPVQIEYAGVPESCSQCGEAEMFARFLLEPEIQKILMTKNFMLPVVDDVRKGTEFENLPEVKILEIKSLDLLLRDRAELLERWRELGL